MRFGLRACFVREQELLDKIVLTDAQHTNQEIARHILFEGRGDYLMTVKANQPTLHKNLEPLFVEQSFSPSADGQDPRAQTGAVSNPPGAAANVSTHSLPPSSRTSSTYENEKTRPTPRVGCQTHT